MAALNAEEGQFIKHIRRCCHLLEEIKNKILLLLCHLRSCVAEEPAVEETPGNGRDVNSNNSILNIV